MTRILVRERAASSCLFIALPHDPLGGDDNAHWWRLTGDAIEAGIGPEWRAIAVEPGQRVIGLAPTALVRLAFSPVVEGVSSPRQAATIARIGALEASLGDPQTLHLASVDLAGSEKMTVTAIVANGKMQEWLDWADRQTINLDHIVPAAMVLPLDAEWTAVSIGTERIIGRRGTVLPDEPSIKDAILEGNEQPSDVDPRDLELALVRLSAAPRPDLRTGRFARRRRIVIDRTSWRELAMLALAIFAVTTVIALTEIIKLNSSRSSLDAETLRIARAVAGPGITLDNAEATLAARAGQAGGSGLTSGVAALLMRLQSEQNVSLSALGYDSGNLRFTVSGQGPDGINRVLLALQRDGYRVSAVPRTQSDGRTLAEVTLGNAP